MTNDRLYTLDANDKIIFGFNHACDDDQAAIALARTMWAAGQPAEVWRGPVKLRIFAALDRTDLIRQPPEPFGCRPSI